MSERLLTLDEVLQEAERSGLDLKERTFRYYAILGLLPRPVKNPAGADDARLAWYPSSIMQRLHDIRSLQAEGYSLKQIKQYFGLRESVPVVAGPSEEPRIDVVTFLRAISGPAPVEIGRRFLVEVLFNPDEDSFRRAATRYYEDLLTTLFGRPMGSSLRAALAGLNPLELEALLRPLREWRDRERARQVSSGRRGLQASEHLRRVVTALQEGRKPEARHVRALESDCRRISEVRGKLERLEKQLPPWLASMAVRVEAVLATLEHDLLGLLDEMLEAEQVVKVAESAEETLQDVLTLLGTLEKLVVREQKASAGPRNRPKGRK